MVDVSVVAVSWNTADCLPAVLDALPAAFAAVSFETIVVDNGSIDDSVATLEARDDVCLVPLDTNRGFTAAANIGARHARGRYLLFLNPDVDPPPGSIATLVAALERRPGSWGATPAFRNPDGTTQRFWIRFPGLPSLLLAFTGWGRRVDQKLGARCRRRRNYADLPADRTRPAINAAGAACLLVRRKEFLHADGFDERFFNFFQDGDFARRMWQQGRTLLGVNDVAVVHGRGVTVNRLSAADRNGQYLKAFRQYADGEPLLRRWAARLSIAVDLWAPGGGGAELRRHARR